jgi:hypothetical protein
LALDEGIAEQDDAGDAAGFGLRRRIAEAQSVVAGFDRPGVTLLDRVEAVRSERPVAAVVFGKTQVDVEVPARVRGVTIEQRSPARVVDASSRKALCTGEAREPQERFDDDGRDEERSQRPCLGLPLGGPCPDPSTATIGFLWRGNGDEGGIAVRWKCEMIAPFGASRVGGRSLLRLPRLPAVAKCSVYLNTLPAGGIAQSPVLIGRV